MKGFDYGIKRFGVIIRDSGPEIEEWLMLLRRVTC
jgi:hypothetical protein